MPQSVATLVRPTVPTSSRLSALHRAVPAQRDEREILSEMTRTARTVLSADVVLVLAGDGRRLPVIAHAGLDEDTVALGGLLECGLLECEFARAAIREGRPVVLNGRAVRDELFAGAALGLASALIVPLPGSDGPVGVLVVGNRSDRSFSCRDTAMLEFVAQNAAGAMDNLRLQAGQRGYTTELQRQCEAMRRVREAHSQLVRASLDGACLEELVAVLGNIVSLPLMLINPQGARMAGVAQAGDLDALWKSCQSQAGFTRRLAELETTALEPPGVAETTGPCHVVPVVAGSETLAVLVVLDATGLGDYPLAVLEEGSSFLAAELLRELSVLHAEVRLHGGLLESLMGTDDTQTVETRAALLGIDLQAPQCAVAVAWGESGPTELPVAIAAGQSACARIGVRGIFAQLDEAFVALLVSGDRCVSREVVADWSETYKAELAQRDAEVPEAIGISTVPMAAGRFREAVSGAQQALRVGRTCRLGVTFLQDVELLAVFADSMKHEQIKGYVDHYLGELLAYDARTNSQLAHTLEVYLDHSCVARHAAAALYLHPHSLRYRLRRIEELQGLNLHDSFSRLTAHLATKVRPLVDEVSALSP